MRKRLGILIMCIMLLFSMKSNASAKIVIKNNKLIECSIKKDVYVIPKNIKYIKYNAFDKSKKLRNIKVEKGNKYFYSYKGVVYRKSDDELRVIPKGKKKFIMSDKCKRIFAEAFNNCTELSYIYIGKNLVTIPGYAFYNNPKLKTIKVHKDKKNIYVKDNVLFQKFYNIDDSEHPTVILLKFPAMDERDEYVIPDDVYAVEQAAFEYVKLESLTLPVNVKRLSDLTFANASITSMTIESDNCYFYYGSKICDAVTDEILVKNDEFGFGIEAGTTYEVKPHTIYSSSSNPYVRKFAEKHGLAWADISTRK